MLQTTTLQFLKNLKKNNNKPWFDDHRKVYENAKTDFYQLISAIITEIGKFDVSLSNLTAKDCTFRINRDVRFSKDKSPYKTNMGASFNIGGKKLQSAGYYFHLEPGKSFIGGGLYMPMPPLLAKVRQEIDYNFDDWKKIVENKTFTTSFKKGIDGIDYLIRPPKGYEETNPAISYLKMKNFIVSKSLTDKDLVDKNLKKEIVKTFQTMKPFINFLNRGME
ncbi:MAG: DUF2461 domain-containing protein [Chitinophagaceae bacterium]|nr:DUF2461 domain-containing protein [Chitinophagaceae bacterium]